jgi:subtilisin family serine protease
MRNRGNHWNRCCPRWILAGVLAALPVLGTDCLPEGLPPGLVPVSADQSDMDALEDALADAGGDGLDAYGPAGDGAEISAADEPDFDLDEFLDDEDAAAAQEQPAVPGRLLVKFKPGVGHAKRQEVLALHGARETGRIEQIGVHIIELPAQANERAHARAMRGRKEVEFAEPDYYAAPALTPNDPWYNDKYTPQWHLPKIDAPAAWDTTTGSSSVVIAILDTGVYGAHEDLASKMVAGWNVYDNNGDTSDKTGHGTLVAGAAAAASDNGIGVASVAWGCKVMPIVVSDAFGFSSSSKLASGLIWGVDEGALVFNISFQGVGTNTLTNAAEYVQSKGGVVIQGAGNSGDYDASPDNPFIIKVSATDENDLVCSWSVTGNPINLSAPGVNIITTNSRGTYSSAGGTSLSTPIVSGVAALVMSANPDLTGQQVQDILKQSADDLGPAGWDPSYGWGRVNAARAVQMAVAYANIRLVPGDFDSDGDVDADDLLHLRRCLTGPSIRQTDPDCLSADLDRDGDVDQDDFGIFQRCFSGSGVLGNPDCAN